MTISIKTILVWFAFCVGFIFGNAAFAADAQFPSDLCSEGSAPLFTYSYYGTTGQCTSSRDCATKAYGGDGVINGTSQGSFYYKYKLDEVITANSSQVYFSTTRTSYHNDGTVGIPVTGNRKTAYVTYECFVDNPCSDFEGQSVSTSMNASATHVCMANGCDASITNPDTQGKNVSVAFFDSPNTIYTSVYYSGLSCSLPDTPTGVAGVTVQDVNGIPTFTNSGVSVSLPSTTDGSSGNIQEQANALNPTKSIDIQNSTLTDGIDTSASEVPKSSDTFIVNNIVNNSGATGSFTMSWDDNGGNTGGETGGETGGNTGGETGGNTGGATGGNTGGETDMTATNSKLDSIKDAVDEIGDGVAFSGDDVGTFGGITDSFVGRVTSSPLLSMGSDISFSVSGSCTPITASTMFGNLSTSLHCQLWDGVKGLLGSVMLFVWALFGIRIIMSA